ncbi:MULTISPECIES: MarC family protein [Streptomycetaceae]|uniref:MarC family protein n=1 Tax=Streptomycetaceae TaxID=2062 RepID=UPI000CDC7606|nr:MULTISPECIES: MarC family protein [Streptomycetaceae]AUY51960.1 antibiotic resistance protein [Streptomyces sp. CB01881]MBP0451811.1 MarC family protein [Kitasatospora sp. RG8]TYC71391.1 MarC family protein [Streptomyces sp. CB01881]
MFVFNLSGAFIAFFAVVGPPKVLLSFARLAATRSTAELRQLAAWSTLISAVIAVVLAYTADAVTSLFHISDQSLQLAGGTIFFVYAVALVLGIHLGVGPDEADEHLPNPMVDGIRELLLPYIASPLAVTAVLVASLSKDDWGWRTTIVGAYLAVVVINYFCVAALAPLMRRTHRTSLEVLSRLLGLLLAAVGVELFLNGLAGLGVHLPDGH